MPKTFKIMFYAAGSGAQKANEIYVGRGQKKETIKDLTKKGFVVSSPVRAERRSAYA